MKLFLIKRKSDGMFLRAIEGHYSLHSGQDKTAWSTKPQVMFKTPDGVIKNLRRLCSTPFWQCCGRFKELGWRDFDEEKLPHFEVVCMDVDIISMTATPAADFAQVSAVRSIPLNRIERDSGHEGLTQ